MAQTTDHVHNFDPAIQSEDIAFKQGDLIACRGCGRTNPPNRAKCLYCSHDLEITATNSAETGLNLRKLEIWEHGWNIICRGATNQDGTTTAKIGDLIGLEPDTVNDVLNSTSALPIARVESESEASILSARLAQLGIDCFVLADETLDPDRPPTRLKAIAFLDGGIAVTNFNTNEKKELPKDEIALLVPGTLVSSKTDSLEKRGMRGKTTVVNETATVRDEAVLDIYRRSDPHGFRVHLTGFDFSCLGADKQILATENLRLLTNKLMAYATVCRIADDYRSVCHLVDRIWEVEFRKAPSGPQRSGFGKVGFGAVASTSNAIQFTKFSRSQWHLL